MLYVIATEGLSSQERDEFDAQIDREPDITPDVSMPVLAEGLPPDRQRRVAELLDDPGIEVVIV